VTEQGYSIAEAARFLGLNENLIRNWKQALQDQGEHAIPGIEGLQHGAQGGVITLPPR
jgi:transposase-like protein